MQNCPVCKKDTPPIKIGGQSYCSVCGSVVGATQPAAPKLAMDMTPRVRDAQTPIAAAPPVMTPAPRPGTSADALHGTLGATKVLDLRNVTPQPVVPAAPAHALPAAPPHATVVERHQVQAQSRLEKVRQIQRSTQIQKFGAAALAAPDTVAPAAPVFAAAPAVTVFPPVTVAPVALPALAITPTPTAPPAPQPAHALPAPVVTQHEAMIKLTQSVPLPKLTPQHARSMATVAAVALMVGYIWLQNYPKLALQNASNQAGLAASMPGYLPSSYSLKSTNTSPGLVVLSFGSPSVSEPLQISQHRTTWDSSSLLDNFVAHQATAYSAVQGQGLTIFLFNNSQASWVNHGIWYSVAGASRLSREQILKIAYSL